ncbi:hypothetical protein OAO55_02575 [Bacteroidales bacterium]|nr:hypothetical protein [Bacteroidales bacterium]
MRFFLTCILIAFSSLTFASNAVNVILNDGTTIQASGYGQIDCDGNKYFDHQFMIKGKYNNVISEISNFSKIEKIELVSFSKEPISTGSNEKSIITVFKKNGISYSLNEASISLSCYGVGDKYNQLVFHVFSPVTEKAAEIFVKTKDIKYIIFK